MSSIRKKIMAGMILTASVFVVLMGIINCSLMSKSAVDELKQMMGVTVEVASDQVSSEIERYKQLAELAGSRSDLADPMLPPEQKQNVLNQLAGRYGMTGANLLDANGVGYFDGVNYSDKDYVKNALSGTSYISAPDAGQGTGNLSITVSAPLWQGGVPGTQVVGAVYFVSDANFLNDIMSGIELGENGTAYMIDKNGYTIADVTADTVNVQNIEQEALKNKGLSRLAQAHGKIHSGQSSVLEYDAGIKKVAACAPVEGTDGWGLGITVPRNDFMGDARIAIGITAALVIISAVLAILLAERISKRIADPIRACIERLGLLAEGDLRSPVPDVETNDETSQLVEVTAEIVGSINDLVEDENRLLRAMGDGNFDIRAKEEIFKGDFVQLLKGLRYINQKLSATLREIDNSANQVSEGAEQVSAGAQALSQGATEQASSVQELAATLNEISRNTKTNSEAAQKANETSQMAGGLLQKSQEKMKELLAAMKDIDESSGEIKHIIKTIEDIAFQTNILALNAAVEAARAGEAGKGFAVVADEVRNLAGKSAEASKDTSTLIERSIAAAQKGRSIASETASTLEESGKIAEQAVASIASITENSRLQSDAVEQVSIGIDQISSVIQTNSATAQESAAASGELSCQAESLKRLVGEFNLKKEGKAAMPQSEPAVKPGREKETAEFEAEQPAFFSADKY